MTVGRPEIDLGFAVGQTWRTSDGRLAHVVEQMTLGYWKLAMDSNPKAMFTVYRSGRWTRGGSKPVNVVSRVARVYIAGPMTGLPESNYPAFHAAAADYRARGNFVISPAELHPKGPLNLKKEWAEYMRVDIAALMTCEIIVMLDGWTQSKGARLEHHNARELDFAICYPANETAVTTHLV